MPRLSFVVLLSLAMAAQAQPHPDAQADYRITGTVVDSLTSQPLPGVKVSIYSSEDPEVAQHTTADSQGNFVFANLAPAKYTLTGSTMGYRSQGYHQHGDYFVGIAVGPDIDTGHITFRLVADARIEGAVTDEDGEPVRNAGVQLYQRSYETGRQLTRQFTGTVTDDRGRYLFSHLGPGVYFVAVSARPWYAQYPNPGEPPPDADNAARVADERSRLDVAYPLTFYPSTEESSSASAITLRPGDRVTADISLRAAAAVHLRIRTGDPADAKGGGLSGRGFPRVSQRIFEGTLVPVMSSQGQTISTGVYEYTGIAPGHYVVEMPDPGGKHGSGWYKEIELSGTTELDAHENPPLAAVTGTLAFEGGSRPREKPYVVLLNRQSSETFAAEVKPNGTFDFSEMEVRPGNYDIVFNGTEGFQIKDMVARGARIAGTTLEISGGSVQLALTATKALARINGTVMRNDQPHPGAMVVLVPSHPANSFTLFRRDESDSDGTFSLRDVLPGTYTVIALENGWELDWASPATLAPYLKNGVPIEVSGEMKLTVKVPLQ